jgi:plasmid stability protein
MNRTMVQIRNVPADFHRRLKARAAMEGMSMSDYIMREMKKSLDVPTRQEVLDRIRARALQVDSVNAAKIIREERHQR